MQISDIHNHSLLKPFGEFKSGRKRSNNPNKHTSVWHNNPMSLVDEFVENLSGVSLYSQSDFTSCAQGNVILICLSIYAPEKEFFINKIEGIPGSDLLETLITGYGTQRIKQIETNSYNYFQDTIEQWNFLMKYSGVNSSNAVSVDGKKWFYQVIQNKFQLQELEKSQKNVIAVIPTFEGAHCFANSWLKEQPDDVYKIDWEARISYIRDHCKPLFLTFAHHFYNGLCGQVKSIPDPINKIIDQSQGMEYSITSKGWEVLDLLLKPEKKILVDIKHMNVKSRRDFYNAWSAGRWGNVPIIFSHGGVNSKKSVFNDNQKPQSDRFNDWDINLFDDEIVFIAKSDGLIGLNLDQRVMSSVKALDETKNGNKEEKRDKTSALIFNHIAWIANVLDKLGMPAWDHICIGSDFDGMINPIDHFRTENEMEELFLYIKKHLLVFINNGDLSPINKLDADLIINKIAYYNMRAFIDKYYL